MNIEQFMHAYKAAWEQRDEAKFASLFAVDGEYHNTPFAVQRGHEQLAEYWRRVKLQEDVRVTYEVLSTTPTGGIAHWHVTYQVASEELFEIWAKSAGTCGCRSTQTLVAAGNTMEPKRRTLDPPSSRRGFHHVVWRERFGRRRSA